MNKCTCDICKECEPLSLEWIQRSVEKANHDAESFKKGFVEAKQRIDARREEMQNRERPLLGRLRRGQS